MMVTWVRGLFKDIRGSVEWDRESFERTPFEARCRLSRRVGDAVLGGRWELRTTRRIGFEAGTRVGRHDFGVSWNDQLPGGGVVVSNLIDVALDMEAILLEDLEATEGDRRAAAAKRLVPARCPVSFRSGGGCSGAGVVGAGLVWAGEG